MKVISSVILKRFLVSTDKTKLLSTDKATLFINETFFLLNLAVSFVELPDEHLPYRTGWTLNWVFVGKMFAYILAVLIAWIIWKLNAAFHKDPYEDFSTTSVPLMKNSFNILRLSPGETLIARLSYFNFLFVHRRTVRLLPWVCEKIWPILSAQVVWTSFLWNH